MRKIRTALLPVTAFATLALVAGTGLAAWHAPAAAAETVKVDLAEWTLGFTSLELDGGKVRFVITNTGTAPHALALEGEAGGEEIHYSSRILRPGESAELEVELPAGSYVAYCPVGSHRSLGMEARIETGEAY